MSAGGEIPRPVRKNQKISQMRLETGASKKSTNTSLMAVSEIGLNAQVDAQWDVADSRGWLKRISKLDAA